MFITDGYSMGDVHAANGEHPLGLALDIVPDFDEGGTWADITSLALWAEPRQNRPRAPFRWVGYNGDAGPRPRPPPASLVEPLGRPSRATRRSWSTRCAARARHLRRRRAGRPRAIRPPEVTGGRNGGVSPKRLLAPPVVETGGVGVSD